jgi:tetratricopeptide (TPR) repeat protein
MKNGIQDWRRAAVIVAVGLLATAGAASAQTRREDGRALDANSRVGSGGRNESAPNAMGNGQVGGNQIITGNVTAGRQFRGVVPYTDPGSFRGLTSGSFSSDRFVRQSAGVPTRFGNDVDLTRPSTYYGSGRAVPPPVGYLPTAGATGGYVGTDQPGAPNMGLTRSYSPTIEPTFRSSELIMPAQDAANQESVLSASPLYGVRVWRAGESPNDFLAGRREGQSQGQQSGAPDRGDRFRADPNSIQRMRDELNRAGQGNDNDPTGQSDQGGQGGNSAGQPTGVQGLQRPLDTSINAAVNGSREQQAGAGSVAAGPLNATVGTGAIQSSVTTGQSIQRRLVISPEKQTPQLARLRRAYERQQGGNPTDVEAARQFNRELLAQRSRPAQGNDQPGAQGGQVPPGGREGTAAPPAQRDVKVPATPDQPAAPQDLAPAAPEGGAAQPQAPETKPEKIDSIAEGVQAKGLRDVLASAENFMHEKKFSAALQQYDVAQQVAPNNALITMGRANAELAASYYRRAETSLRDAVGRAPELVVAQFDLRSLIGDERLQVLVRDLKDLAQNDPKQPRPMLLLAYVAYNTGNEAQAGEYLSAAEQRTGGEDALLQAWRRNWKLPAPDATAPATEQSAPAPAQGDQNK